MKLASLLDYVDWDRLALPPFNLHFTWTAAMVTRLFDSLYRDYPVGGLVLWSPRAAGPFPVVSIRDSSPEFLLDGAQRVIAIYTAMRGRAPGFLESGKIPNLTLGFNVETERFALWDSSMAADARWICLPKFFSSRQPAVGEAWVRLQSTRAVDDVSAEFARRVQYLASIWERGLFVEYMPSSASLEECHEFHLLVNRRTM